MLTCRSQMPISASFGLSVIYDRGVRLPIFQPHPRSTLTTLGVTAAVKGTRRKMKLLWMAYASASCVARPAKQKNLISFLCLISCHTVPSSVAASYTPQKAVGHSPMTWSRARHCQRNKTFSGKGRPFKLTGFFFVALLRLLDSPACHFHFVADIVAAQVLLLFRLQRFSPFVPSCSHRFGDKLGDGGHDVMFDLTCLPSPRSHQHTHTHTHTHTHI